MKPDPNYQLRKARYVYEDFQESVAKLRVLAYICLLLGGILLCSSGVLGADSYGHALFSVTSGVVILLSPNWLELEEKSMIYFLMIAYFAVIGVEYLSLGLPDPLIPGLGAYSNVKLVAVITIINGLTPVMYFGIRIAAAYLFVRLLIQKQKVDQLPTDLKGRLGIKK